MGYVARTEAQQMAIDNFRRYLADVVEPLYNKEYRDRFVPKEVLIPVMRRLSEFGLVSGSVSAENGGLGLDFPTIVMLFEELAATSSDLAVPVIINSGGAVTLEKFAPAHLRQRYLPGLIAGEIFMSAAISEPDVGSNVTEIKARARREGGDWVLNGEKCWISNGSYSDFMVCICRTGDEPGDLTYFLLDRKDHPYQVREINKVAFNSQSTTQIFLSDVRVPHENMLGTLNGAFKSTLSGLERGRVFVGAQAVGVARRALEEAIRYTKERRQHGKPIAGHQLVSAMLADMATRIDAARLLVLRAAEMVQAGIRAEMEASMAKYMATEMAVEVCRQAVQLHGGNGSSKEFLVEKLARDALLPPIYEGTTQVQQLIIGRALTGLRAF